MNNSDYNIVYTTTSTEDQASYLARELVFSKLAGCATIIKDSKSIYYWDNVIHEEKEIIILIKTLPHLLDSLKKKIMEIHPYKCPAISILSVKSGSKSYLGWLLSSCTSLLDSNS